MPFAGPSLFLDVSTNSSSFHRGPDSDVNVGLDWMYLELIIHVYDRGEEWYEDLDFYNLHPQQHKHTLK